MNIGIDIDGVLTCLEDYISSIGKNFAIKNGLGFDDNMSSKSIYGFLSKKDSHRFWDEYWEHYAKNITIRPFAKEVISELKKEGNNIFIITARTYDRQIVKDGIKRQKNMENMIRLWLKKNEIIYDKLLFSDLNKLKTCLDNNIDIMIEDSIANIDQLKGHMKIICFNAKYNNDYKDNNVIRVYNWKNIYSIIKKF